MSHFSMDDWPFLYEEVKELTAVGSFSFERMFVFVYNGRGVRSYIDQIRTKTKQRGDFAWDLVFAKVLKLHQG